MLIPQELQLSPNSANKSNKYLYLMLFFFGLY